MPEDTVHEIRVPAELQGKLEAASELSKTPIEDIIVRTLTIEFAMVEHMGKVWKSGRRKSP